MNRTLLRRAAPLALVLFSLAAAAPSAPPLKSAKDMQAAKGKDAVDIRDSYLKAAPPPSNPVDRDQFVRKVVDPDFRAILTCSNADARLNTAILFAELDSLSCDAALMDMLKNPDPAVRLWGAKGLASLAPSLKRVNPARATAALKSALAAEKDDTVKTELAKSLAAY